MHFCYFVIISSFNGVCPFIWTNLNSLHRMMLCAKFCWNRPTRLREKDLKNFVNLFSLFRNISLWEWAWTFILTNLNPLNLRIPCLIEISPMVLEKSKMWKVYRQTVDGRQVIRKAHLSFQLSWGLKDLIIKYTHFFKIEIKFINSFNLKRAVAIYVKNIQSFLFQSHYK